MALSKTVVLPTGVSANYFRVDGVNFQPGAVSLNVGIYTTAAAAQAGASPLTAQRVRFESAQFTRAMVDAGQLLPTAYNAIKAYASAPDAPNNLQADRGLLVGNFEDA